LVKFGRRKTILLNNVILCINVVLMIILNHQITLIIFRLGYGISIGIFSCTCNIFVREIVPNKDSGLYAGLSQTILTLGIMFASIVGLYTPDFGQKGSTVVWRVLFGIPLLFSSVQILLFVVYFKYDTPTFYKVNNMKKYEMEAYRLIYNNTDKAIQRIIKDNYSLLSETTIDPLIKMKAAHDSKSVFRLCKKPYKNAMIIGCLLSCLQQFTGINTVIFYSSSIFSSNDEDIYSGKYGTLLVGVVNCLTAMIGIFILANFDRRPLFYNGMIGMAVSLALLSYFHNYNWCLILFSLVFLAFFEFSIGSLLGIYLAEIMTPTGIGFALSLNWM
jgi:MFS family permease